MGKLIKQIRDEKPSKIFYGVNTCWWTHKASDLQEHPSGLPCDPAGGMLLETDDVDGFLQAAEDNPEHYGEYGLKAFEAAHHSSGIGPFRAWGEYNKTLGGDDG